MTSKNIDQNKFPSEKDLKNKKANPKSKSEKTTEKKSKESKSTGSDKEIVDKLLTKNQELEKKLKESDDKALRLQAEIQNIEAHNSKDQAELIKYDGQKLAKSILPSVDNLQRALAAKSDDDKGIRQGVEMVLKHLKQALAENKVVEIEADGKKFDPTVHQAVQTVPADKDHPAETVVQVLQPGYKLKDRVLRPSMVVVAQ